MNKARKNEPVELVEGCTLMKVHGNKIMDLRSEKCEGYECEKCGWNEDVIARREEEYYGRKKM